MLTRNSSRALVVWVALTWSVSAVAQQASGDASAQMGAEAAQAAHNAEQDRAMQAEDEEARQHFQIGRTLLASGRFQEASEEFQEAYRLSGRPQLLYNLYIAHRDAGNLNQAIDSLRGYLDRVPDAPDRVNLRARLRSLEEQALKKAEREAQAKQAAEEAARARAEATLPRTRTVTEKSVVPWILVGAGGAIAAGSLATGFLAKGKASDLEKKCIDGKRCPPGEQGEIDATKTLALTTDILWISGATVATAGLILWLSGALDREREVPVAGLGVSPHGLSASMSTRF